MFSGGLHRCHKQQTFFLWQANFIQIFPLVFQCNGFMYIHTAFRSITHSSFSLQVVVRFQNLVHKQCVRQLELRHRDIFPAKVPRAPLATQACCNHRSSSLPVYFFEDFALIQNFVFAQTAVANMQQIRDCSVCVGWHYGCCVVQGCESCLKLLSLEFFNQGVVHSFWDYPCFICEPLLAASLVFVVPFSWFCLFSMGKSDHAPPSALFP